jgi:hypothetical protein
MSKQNETTFPVLVKQLADNLLAHIEYVQLNAKVQRTKYEALVKEGFTEQQALELTK